MTTNEDGGGIGTRLTRGLNRGHTRKLTSQHVVHRRYRSTCQIFCFNTRKGTGNGYFLLNTIGHNLNALQHGRLLLEGNLHVVGSFDDGFLVANIRDFQLGAWSNFQREVSVKVRDRTLNSLTTNDDNTGTNDRFALTVNDRTSDGSLLLDSSVSFLHTRERRGNQHSGAHHDKWHDSTFKQIDFIHKIEISRYITLF